MRSQGCCGQDGGTAHRVTPIGADDLCSTISLLLLIQWSSRQGRSMCLAADAMDAIIDLADSDFMITGLKPRLGQFFSYVPRSYKPQHSRIDFNILR